MVIRHAGDFLYLFSLKKCEANWVLNSLKVPMELSVNLLNQILAGHFSIVGKTLHYT